MTTSTEPEAPGTNDGPPKKAKIGPEERARRKKAVDAARASVRLEGFVVSPFAEDLNRRYIDGEITRKEMTALLLAYHKQ